MPRITIRDVGRIGLITDIPAHELPPEAWTVAENVDFHSDGVRRIGGETQVEGAPTVNPHFIFPMQSATQPYWVYTDMDDMYSVVGGTHTKITRAAGIYTGGLDDKWSGSFLNGIAIFNNGIDDPQLWNPIDSGTPLIDLTNWPANTKAKVIRSYRNFLIALNTTENGTNFTTRVKWSDAADPGTVPSSWDEADATKLAGEIALSETPGKIVDGRPLGASFMVYKEDAVYRLDRVNTNAIMVPRAISLRTGIMGQECAQEFSPGQHVVLTLDADVVITDGQTIRSITTDRIRTKLETLIDPANRRRSFIVVDYTQRQVWVCFPQEGSTYCDRACIWEWEDNTWSERALTPTLDIKAGLYDQSAVSEAWSAQTDTWADTIKVWGGGLFTADSFRMLGGLPVADHIREFNKGDDFAGTEFTSLVRREGLSIAGTNRDGTPRVDPNMVKLITEVYPLITAEASMNMNIRVGMSDRPNGPTTWGPTQGFDPTVDEKVDTLIEGRYAAIEFSTTSSIRWAIQGYGLNVHNVGEYF